MKKLSYLAVLLLISALSACSSGSSNETEPQTSTNTIPPSNNSDDEPSAGPSDDEPNADANAQSAGGTDGGTDGDTVEQPDENAGAQTDGNVDAQPNDGTDVGADAENATAGNVDSNGAGANEPEGNSGGSDGNGAQTNTTETDGGENNIPMDTNTDIDINTPLGQIQQRVQLLTGRTLLALNQSLSQGELLSEQQETCLGSYDPAIGAPLLSIACDQELATGSVPIYASIASLKDSPECRASIQNANADECEVDQALLTVNTKWYETDRRPQPKAGAAISYNIVEDRLRIENLEQSLSGNFICEYDLTNGDLVDTGSVGNCNDTLQSIVELIDDHLADETDASL